MDFEQQVWQPALAAAGVIPKPVKDKRGRRRYVTDRKSGVHALPHLGDLGGRVEH